MTVKSIMIDSDAALTLYARGTSLNLALSCRHASATYLCLPNVTYYQAAAPCPLRGLPV